MISVWGAYRTSEGRCHFDIVDLPGSKKKKDLGSGYVLIRKNSQLPIKTQVWLL